MRKRWLGAAFVLLALVLPALAQQPAGQPNANQFFTGVDPRKVNLAPVNSLRAMQGGNAEGALKPSAAQSASKLPNLNSFFRNMTIASWPPRRPTFGSPSAFPVPKVSTVAKGNVNLFALPK